MQYSLGTFFVFLELLKLQVYRTWYLHEAKFVGLSMYVYVGKCTDNSWYDTSRDNTIPIFQIYTYLYSILPILVRTTDFCMYLNLNYRMVLCELYTV